MGRHSRPPRFGALSVGFSRIGTRALASVMLGGTLLLLARTTDVAQLGTFMTAYASGLIVGLLAGLGAPIRALRAPAECPGFTGTVYRLHTISTTVVFGIVIGTAAWMTSTTVIAGLVFAFGDTLLNYAQAHLTAVGKNRFANVFIVAHRMIPLLTVLAFWLTADRVDFGALTAALLLPALLAFVAPWDSDEQRARPSYRAVLGGRQFAYLGYAGAGVLSQLQIPVLQSVASAATVGAYSVANRVTGPITLLTTSLTGLLVPAMARHTRDLATLNRMHRRIMAACAAYVAIMVTAAWPAGWAIARLAGDQYHGAVLLVASCVVAAALSSASQGANVKLLALGRPALATVPIAAGNVAGLILLVVLGRTGDIDLLGIAPIVAEMIVLSLMLLTTRRATE